MNLLPDSIKSELLSNYLFNDIFRSFRRFFELNTHCQMCLLSDITYGFQPRIFQPYDDDKIIYDENQEVAELYFIQEGFIGIGFSLVSHGINNRQYTISKRQEGLQLICDHYVINKKNSQFVYIALGTSKGYALSWKFLHKSFFPKHRDFEFQVKS